MGNVRAQNQIRNSRTKLTIGLTRGKTGVQKDKKRDDVNDVAGRPSLKMETCGKLRKKLIFRSG